MTPKELMADFHDMIKSMPEEAWVCYDLSEARDIMLEQAARIAELERENRRVKNIIYAYEAVRAALNGEKASIPEKTDE
jgi:hypothetical protein